MNTKLFFNKKSSQLKTKLFLREVEDSLTALSSIYLKLNIIKIFLKLNQISNEMQLKRVEYLTRGNNANRYGNILKKINYRSNYLKFYYAAKEKVRSNE